MSKVVWITDPHLNHSRRETVEHLLFEVNRSRPVALLISGDFSESMQLLSFLNWIEREVTCRTYFVLGNHDYYFSSVGIVRRQVRARCGDSSRLLYLSEHEPVELLPGVALIGHDGWADGRAGNYETSLVMMHDYRLIHELKGLGKRERWNVMQELAAEGARHVEKNLKHALKTYDKVVLVTHVPPFREACWHEGKISDDQWAPHFVSIAMGEVILKIMGEHPHADLLVLCGHTHGEGITYPLPNVCVRTGGAVYGFPSITEVFDRERLFHWREQKSPAT